MRELKIFSGRAHPSLTEEICTYLQVAPGRVTLYSFWTYSVPRVQLLYRYNEIEQSFLDAIEERRDGRPLLVIMRGPETGATPADLLDPSGVTVWATSPSSAVGTANEPAAPAAAPLARPPFSAARSARRAGW